VHEGNEGENDGALAKGQGLWLTRCESVREAMSMIYPEKENSFRRIELNFW